MNDENHPVVDVREKIFTLHELSEKEQCDFLLACFPEVFEIPEDSFPEIAFRLRDEFIRTHKSPTAWKLVIAKLACPVGDWMALAQPIHWIQAALLAKTEGAK